MLEKRRGKFIAFVMLLAMCSTVFMGCSNSKEEKTVDQEPVKEETPVVQEKEVRTVTDAQGNQLEVPTDISKIAVVPLPWSSVIYAIDGTSERMVSINPGAMTAYPGSFFESLDKNYGSIDTTGIGKDLSINVEEMVNRGVQAVVIWNYQTDEAKQLKDLGIVPIMVKNETIEELQASFHAIGQLLGKEERAEQFNASYKSAYDSIKSYSDKVAAAEKPKVLYLRDAKLTLQGNDNFMKEALEIAGADNVAADAKDITMEEILELNPDVILLSNFDSFVPSDLYENKIDGQDWSNVSAVVNQRVYKTPMGIYRWDAPGVETPLMMMWLAQLVQPDIFSDMDFIKKMMDYYSELFDYTLTDADSAQILSSEANSFSK